MNTQDRDYSNAFLDTVEAFLDTNPELDLAGVDAIEFPAGRTTSSDGAIVMRVIIDGVEYEVTAKKAK